MSHSNANNNTAAIITDVSAESWDNNVVFQVDLDQKIGVAIEEYRSGIDQYHLSTQPTNIKVLSSIPEPRNGEQDNDTLTIEVKNSSGNEINIAIKSKNVDDHFTSNNNNTILSAKRRLKKKKNRSYSESHCDELKVISESECLSNTEDPTRNINVPNHKETARKTRSISESYQDVCHSESDHHNLKYKSILKYSYDRSVSFGSSVDELFFSASLDFGGSTDPELSESCKKSVRFSEHITRQLYRSNSSILGQRKKNQRKNEAKKRASQRKNNECESGDEDKDTKENDDSSTEPLPETTAYLNSTPVKISKKHGKHESVKPNMIFDLEI